MNLVNFGIIEEVYEEDFIFYLFFNHGTNSIAFVYFPKDREEEYTQKFFDSGIGGFRLMLRDKEFLEKAIKESFPDNYLTGIGSERLKVFINLEVNARITKEIINNS